MTALISIVALLTSSQGDTSPLSKLVGKWEWEAELVVAPGQPKQKAKGKESVRALGKYWVICDSSGPGDAILTVGYNPRTKKVDGTWITAMSSDMVRYTGSVSADGKTIALIADLPNPMKGGKKSKFKDEITVLGPDLKTLRSYVQEDNGSWTEYFSGTYKRVKG